MFEFGLGCPEDELSFCSMEALAHSSILLCKSLVETIICPSSPQAKTLLKTSTSSCGYGFGILYGGMLTIL